MAGICKDYSSWRLQNLSNPAEAAYYLLGALEDAIENNIPRHFLKATIEVRKAHPKEANPIFFMLQHTAIKDHEAVQQSLAKLVMLLMEKEQKQHLGELQAA